MWETCSVQLSVRLPRDIAQQAEEVQHTDPDFLSRVILYGLTRRSIYRHLRQQGQDSVLEGAGAPRGDVRLAAPPPLTSYVSDPSGTQGSRRVGER